MHRNNNSVLSNTPYIDYLKTSVNRDNNMTQERELNHSESSFNDLS